MACAPRLNLPRVPYPCPSSHPSLLQDAFENEDLEMMAGSGFEGYVAEGLDLGTTFGPEDGTNHRWVGMT
jgi:hypothetical protein